MSDIFEAYKKHEAAIKRLLSRYFSRRQDIEDHAQEVFLRAYAAELRTDIKEPKSYLFRVAKNVALNEIAKKSGKIIHFVGDSSDLSVLENRRPELRGAALDDAMDARQRLAILIEGVETLPPKCRQAFLLRKVSGFSHKEIAERMGISVKSVEKHLAKGAIKCAEYLRDKGFDPADFATGANSSGTANQDSRERNPKDKASDE